MEHYFGQKNERLKKTNKGTATRFMFVNELDAAAAIMGMWSVPQSAMAKITDTAPREKAIGSPVDNSKNMEAKRTRVRSSMLT